MEHERSRRGGLVRSRHDAVVVTAVPRLDVVNDQVTGLSDEVAPVVDDTRACVCPLVVGLVDAGIVVSLRALHRQLAALLGEHCSDDRAR